MKEVQTKLRRALIRNFYKDVLDRPKSKENLEYSKMLKLIL